MKRNLFIIAAFIGTFFFASCGGGSTDSKILKQADKMYSQAEATIQGVDNFEDFYAFIDEFKATKQEFLQEVVAPAYAVDDSLFNVPDEVMNQIYERATAYNHVEALKYAELFEPYMANLESAVDAALNAGSDAERADMSKKAQEALDAAMPYTTYDNVLPELQEREMAVINKMAEL